MFSIDITGLSNQLSSNPKLFADDSCFFLVIRHTNLSANALNEDQLKINNWTYQWKMSFNLEILKQAQEVTFSRKIKKPNHPVLILDNNKIVQTPYQKKLGAFLNKKLNLCKYLKYIANKVNLSKGLLRKLLRKSFTETIISYYIETTH